MATTTPYKYYKSTTSPNPHYSVMPGLSQSSGDWQEVGFDEFQNWAKNTQASSIGTSAVAGYRTGETMYDYYNRVNPGYLQPGSASPYVTNDQGTTQLASQYSQDQQLQQQAAAGQLQNIGTQQAPLYVPTNSPAQALQQGQTQEQYLASTQGQEYLKANPEIKPVSAPAPDTSLSAKDIEKQDTGVIQQSAQMNDMLKRVMDSYQQAGPTALANEAFIQAVAQAKYGRPASPEELRHVSQGGMIGASLKDVINAFGLSGSLPNMGVTPQDIKGATGATAGQQGLTGTQAAEGTVVDTTPKSALEQKQDLVESYATDKQGVRAEAQKAAGIPAIQEAMTKSGEIKNQYQAKVEEMQSKLELQDILNEETQISLKNKIEGQPIPMSTINRQLTKGIADLTQEQRIDRLYDVYSVNTMINAYNAEVRNLQLLQGQYQMARENAQMNVDDWVEQQSLMLDILTEQGQLEKEERARLDAEIEYERQLGLEGYVHIKDTATYDKLVKDMGVTAETFSQFFYKDPANGKIYLKPPAEPSELEIYAAKKQIDAAYDTGTWQAIKDDLGNIIQYNSQTGETRMLNGGQGVIPQSGTIGGQCGEYINDLFGTSFGDMWENKMKLTNTTSQEFMQNPQVGDIVVFKTKMPYGHVAAVTAVNGDKITLTESNWNEDEKVGTRTISINDPSITGVYRGAALKNQPAQMSKEDIAKLEEQQKAVEKAENALSLISILENHEGLSGAIGAKGITSLFGLKKEPIGGTQTADFVSYFDALKSTLTLENMGVMKGVLSDADIKIIKEASTALSRNMSEATFKKELSRLKEKLQKVKGGVTAGSFLDSIGVTNIK